MSLSVGIIYSFVIVGSAVCACLTPLFSRPEVFFGATVGLELRSSDHARRILSQYRRTIVGAAVCVTFVFAVAARSGANWPIVILASVLLQLAVGIGAFVRANKQARGFAIPQSLSRTVSLELRRRSLPGGWAVFAGPMLILTFAALVAVARRGSLIPEAFHTALSALLAAFFSDALFMWVSYVSIVRTRQVNPGGGAARTESDYRRISYSLYLLVAYFMTCVLVAIAFSVMGFVSRTAVFGAVLVGNLVMVIAVSNLLGSASRTPLGGDSGELTGGDGTPDECWKWGIIYYNPSDSAFLVENRAGYGWTLNCGNKWSWVFSAAILATPFIVGFFWFTLD